MSTLRHAAPRVFGHHAPPRYPRTLSAGLLLVVNACSRAPAEGTAGTEGTNTRAEPDTTSMVTGSAPPPFQAEAPDAAEDAAEVAAMEAGELDASDHDAARRPANTGRVVHPTVPGGMPHPFDSAEPKRPTRGP